jgi:hypothetical protein
MLIPKTRVLTCLFALASLLLAGCASTMMQPSTLSSAADPGRAKVVFMRTSFVAGAVGVELFEVTNGDLKVIGALPSGNKIVHETTPGDKVFMSHGSASDFMTARLVGGRTYYVILRPNWGTGGFAPTPIRADGTSDYHTGTADFRSWLKDTRQIAADPAETQSWQATHKARYKDLYTQYWARYQQKHADEKAQRHLRPEDGVPKPF